MDPAAHQVRSPDGTSIPYWQSGAGRPLLLVHGGGGDHRRWDAVRPYLEPQVRVVTMDRRSAFGDPASHYALEREFEDIGAVAAALGAEVDLLGTSSGAICALGAAQQLPNLRRLLLFEPPWVAGHLPALAPKLERLRAAADLDGVWETMLREGLRVPEASVAAAKAAPAWPAQVERARLIPREMAALAAWRFEPARLQSLQRPVCLLVGGATPADHHHRGFVPRLAAALPDFRVEEIPGVAHGAPQAAPAAFAQRVLAFVQAAAV
jgi:pimeloyl-ACP methyl ester carboxylesterase